jgi:fibronectin-binding autotransporter adhesin
LKIEIQIQSINNRSSLTIYKGTGIMKQASTTSQALRLLGAAILITVLLFGSVQAQGTFTNTGTITNTGTVLVTNLNNSTGTVDNSNGTVKVKGAITNPTANSFDTQTGTVEYVGSGAAQTIIASVKSSTYGNLAGRSGGTKSLAGSITVSGTVTADSNTTVLDIASNTLTVTGATPIAGINSGSFTASTGTVDYAGDVDQSVYPTTYANLTTSGATASRTKTASGNITVTGTITNGINNILDFSTHTLTATGAAFANSNLLKSAGTVTATAGAAINGTFEFYASTGTQTIPAASFVNLTLSSGTGTTGGKGFTAGTTSVSGAYSVAGADRNYSTGTFNYNGANQNIVGDSYYNLTLTGTGLSDVKTATGALAVGGAFTNTLGTGNMGTYALAVTGSKTNTGKMQFAGATNGIVFADGVVEYNGTSVDAASQTIGLGIYNSIIFTNNSPKSITGGTVRTSTDLTVNAGVTANVAGSGILRVDNDMNNAGVVNNAGTVQVGQ